MSEKQLFIVASYSCLGVHCCVLLLCTRSHCCVESADVNAVIRLNTCYVLRDDVTKLDCGAQNGTVVNDKNATEEMGSLTAVTQ